jgi:23S rRNA (uracil1939-C5)-methyltransferase
MTRDLFIHLLGPQGDGVHRGDGGAVYVERALPGERVEAKIGKGAGGTMRGEIVRILSPSPHRAPPPCAHYDVCGGCALQHADAALYRDWKIGIVRAALEKKALAPERWNAPVFLPPGTRRRATFAAVKRGSAVTLGYFRRRSHAVADIAACLVVEPAINAVRARLADALAPVLREGPATDVFIQMLAGRTEVAVTGPIGATGTPDLAVRETVAALAHACGVDRVAWRRRETDEPETMLEINPLQARFGALTVTLPPLAFLQPTQAGEDALVRAVMEALPERAVCADLFAGCGTFTGPMLARGPVDAFETAAAAVGALNRAKGTRPLMATQRDLFRSPLHAKELTRYDAVVFDPPRAGAQAQAKALAESGVPRLVAVSCNPATFARDARLLVDGGYRFESLQLVDQCPWSHHVELVAAFARLA